MIQKNALDFLTTHNEFIQFMRSNNLSPNAEPYQMQSKIFDVNQRIYVYVTMDYRKPANPTDDIMCLIEYFPSTNNFNLLQIRRLI